MKYLPHILLPPILIGLCIAAIYLPKYFQFGKSMTAPASGTESGAQPPADLKTTIQPFVSMLESRDLAGAETELKNLESKIPDEAKTGLLIALLSAKEYQKDLDAAKNMQVETTQLAEEQAAHLEKSLAKAEKQLTDLSAAGLDKIQSSLSELIAKTRAAEDRTENNGIEITKLRETIEQQQLVPPSPEPAAEEEEGSVENLPHQLLPKSMLPLKIPAPLTVPFKDDSTTIPDSVSMYVDQMGEWLEEDFRLGIRLRTTVQDGFSNEKNDILAKTRSTSVKETLIRNGAGEDQIELVPLETETDSSETENNRRTRQVWICRAGLFRAIDRAGTQYPPGGYWVPCSFL